MISEHPTWSIIDSSKLEDWVTCRRKFFYLHLLGWRMDMPAQDLWFGSCWHAAREWQLLHGYHDIEGAFKAFMSAYREHFDPDTDAMYTPKTPTAVLNGLMMLAEQYQHDLVDYKVIELDGKPMTEIAGSVPIDDHRVIHYKMDAVMERLEDHMISAWDHKTTTGKWFHDSRWDAEYYLSIQNGTYTHCLYCMFPIGRVLGVEFHKVGFEFLQRSSKERSAGYHATLRKIMAFKNPEQMNVWLWNVNNYVDEIEREIDRLSHCSESDPVMMAFPLNPKSCMDYKGCPFHDYCIAWSNPLQRCQEPPLGFRTEFWDPREVRATNKLNLTWGQ